MVSEPEPETITYEGQIAHRYSSYDTPFWVRENTQAGRWHRSGDGPTQYLALSTDGAWAELIRNEELSAEDEVAMVSVSMWAVFIKGGVIANYGTFEHAERAGFDPVALVEDNYERCQNEGARLRSQGFSGVLAPSAALPGALNLTLFGPRIASTWDRQTFLASSIPATIITKGAPPPGLLPRVRQLGSCHDALDDYLARPGRRSGSASPGEGASSGEP